MKLLRNLLIAVVAVAGLGVAGLYATGNSGFLMMGWAWFFGGPSQPFEPDDAVAPPDYADTSNWAALPGRAGPEDFVPAGLRPPRVDNAALVDVFFIHPTGYLAGDSWTHSMDPNTTAEENTRWMMANQASAYNGCCNVYAPRYRQASIYAYFKGDKLREQVLSFAYTDVERAFEYFLANHSNGRPFVIASHSQGTHHGIRLLQQKISGTPLAARMVAAYLIGGGLGASEFANMADIGVCATAEETGCAVHWDTWSEAAIDRDMPDIVDNVCVNPLSWENAGGLATNDQHAGAVPVSGEFQVALTGPTAATGVTFEPLQAPMPNLLQAQCKSGALYISDQSDTVFGKTGGSFGGGNYHGLDYPVFHMDIRENAELRAANWLANNG